MDNERGRYGQEDTVPGTLKHLKKWDVEVEM